MLPFLFFLTAAVVIFSMATAYGRYRDPFHPLMYIGPMMLYLWVHIPAVLYAKDLFQTSPLPMQSVEYAQLVHFLSVAALCAGLLKYGIPPHLRGRQYQLPEVTRGMERRLVQLSLVMGAAAVIVYYLQVRISGGFLQVYSTGKPFLRSLGSGYINEMVNLGIPASMLYLYAKSRHRARWQHFIIPLIMLMPILITATLGGRRGPAFLAFAAIGLSFYIFRSKRPSLVVMIGGVAFVGVLMMFLAAHRRSSIYIGAEFEYQQSGMVSRFFPQTLDEGDTTTVAFETITVANEFERYYWGKRYFAQLIARPIPRQIWPSKYRDLGVGWMLTNPGQAGFADSEWRAAVGRVPFAGSATGFIADIYLEFKWGVVPIAYLVGLLYCYLWRRCLLDKGVWVILYMIAAAMSIYLASQGFISAWLYRVLLLGLPTYVLWVKFIDPRRGRRRVITGAPLPPAASLR